jgi:Tfp pilus assembly protein PilO
MFENYSYKQKFHALIVLFFMLSIAAYKRSFHTLLDVVTEYQIVSKKADDINKKSKNTDALNKDIAYLDKIMGKEGISKEMVQQGIVSFASDNSRGISINDLKPIHDFSEDNYHIITNQLDVTGNTNQLLKLTYDFEKKFNLSRIVSMNFYTTKKNNKSEVLHLKMIFQNYENNK